MTATSTRPPSTKAPARPRPTPQQRLRNAATESVIRLLKEHAPVAPPRDRGSVPKIDARAGSYDAASTSRTRAGGPAIGGSFDAHLDSKTHDLIRRDVRHVVRNSNAARAALKRIVSAVVGSGLTLSVDVEGDDQWEKLVEAAWLKDSANLDARGGAAGGKTIAELCSMWVFNVALDGDGLLVLLANGKIQYVEGDRIVTPPNRRGVIKNSTGSANGSFGPGGGFRRPSGRGNATAETETGNVIVSGVEMDEAGAPVAFWVAPHDAADSGGRVLADKAVRVPAENCIYLQQPWTPWANATRGEPILAGSLPMLESLQRLINAEVLAAELAAYIALVIKTEAPAEMADTLQSIAQEAGNIAGGGGPNSGSGGDDDYTGGSSSGGSGSSQTAQQWGPGAVLNLNTGEDVETTNPTRPNQLIDPFARMILRLVFADLGISVDLGLLDSSQSNFHAFKSSTAHTYRGFEPVVSWLMRVLSQIYTWWLRGKIAGEEIPFREDWDSHSWTPQPLPTPDENKLFQALALGSKECLLPISHAHDVLGFKSDQVMKRMLREAPLIRAIREARGELGVQGNDAATRGRGDAGTDDDADDNADTQPVGSSQ